MNTNKLMLLLVAALGMTSGVMAMEKAAGDVGGGLTPHVESHDGKDGEGDSEKEMVVLTSKGRSIAVPMEFLGAKTPAQWQQALSEGDTQTVAAFEAEWQRLNPMTSIRQGLAKAGRSVAQFPARKFKDWKEGYQKAGRRGRAVRGVRDAIQVANVGNAVRELATDSNLLLDALSMNKKLNANKNFAWLRKGKSKSARALRVLITLTQAGLIGFADIALFRRLGKMVDEKDTPAADGELPAGAV